MDDNQNHRNPKSSTSSQYQNHFQLSGSLLQISSISLKLEQTKRRDTVQKVSCLYWSTSLCNLRKKNSHHLLILACSNASL